MRGNIERTAGVSASIMAALMLAVFTVSARFGVMLPLLTYLIERVKPQLQLIKCNET